MPAPVRAVAICLFLAAACHADPALLNEPAGVLIDEPVAVERRDKPAEALEGRPVRPNWMADGASFWFMTGDLDDRIAHVVDPRTNTIRPLFHVPALRDAYREVAGRKAPRKGLPFTSFEFVDDTERVARFRIGARTYDWTFETASLARVEKKDLPPKRPKPRKVRDGVLSGEPAVMEAESPDGRWFAGIEDENVVLRSPDDEERRVLTEDGFEDYGYDLAEAKWSPDGSTLAVMRLDEREVVKLPVMTWLDGAESVELIPFTKPGQPLPLPELHLLRVDGGGVRVQAGDPTDTYLLPLAWRPDGRELFCVRGARDFKRADVLAANPATGATRVVVTETTETFIDPAWSINTAPSFRFLEDGAKFLWLSERDGWNHLYLYSSDGALIRQLTTGEAPIVRVIDVDEERGYIYYSAHGDRTAPYDTQVYRASLAGGGGELISAPTGVHDHPLYMTELMPMTESVDLSPSFEFFVTTHSTAVRPPQSELRRADGELVRVLSKQNVDDGWNAPEPFVVKADDGETDLHGILYKPDDFDPAKKYPVIDYIYNGPQTSWVPHTFGAFQHLVGRGHASRGYVVLIVDGRGTTERGKEFQDVVYGNFGRHEIPDHVATLRQLAAERPYMDLDRVGITGGSYGGYMTLRAVVMAPDVYKAAVSVAPISGLEDVTAPAAEAYVGLLEDNPEAYEYASCTNKADKIEAELLLIHGSADVNAPYGSTIKMIDALVKAGKDFEFIMLPDQPHWPTGAYNVLVNRKTAEFLDRHLRP